MAIMVNEMLKDQVQAVIRGLEHPEELGENDDGRNEDEALTGFDYLEDVLDIEYVVSASREFLGARVLVCFGGPNVWVNTRTGTVEGYWWGSEYSEGYTDNVGLNDTLRELWEMGQ